MPRKKKTEFPTPVGRYKGSKIPDETKEGVLQMLAIDGNKRRVARAFGISEASVYRISGKESPGELRAARREGLQRVASKVHRIVNMGLDNMTEDDFLGRPKKDEKTGEIQTYDNGEVKREAIPSGPQKAIMAGIFTDKLVVLDKRISEHESEDTNAEVIEMMPDTISALIGAIRNDMKEIDLSILKVRFIDDEVVADVIEEAEILEAELGESFVEVVNEDGEVLGIDGLDT